MNPQRRTTLKAASGAGLYSALLAIGLLKPGQVSAQALAEAFKAQGIPATLKALGAADATQSSEITIVSPDIAENGAVVPVGIRSGLAKTTYMALLVEKNPSALAGAYDIMAGAEAEVSMRIKMGQSSDVVAVVKADDKFYMARKEIKVTLGGCGG
jgi:sulfur-oxidizing protein SoxY